MPPVRAKPVMVKLIQSAIRSLHRLRQMGVHVHTCIVFPALATDTREAIKRPHRGVSLEMGMLRLRAHDAVAEQVADCW